MMRDRATEFLPDKLEMSATEEASFLIDVGGFIRDFFEKGLRSASEQRRSECIKAVFVDGQ